MQRVLLSMKLFAKRLANEDENHLLKHEMNNFLE